MARALRIQYPGAYYHVTCRGNERREIYKDEEDRKVFKEKLKQSLSVYGVELPGYGNDEQSFSLTAPNPARQPVRVHETFQYKLYLSL